KLFYQGIPFLYLPAVYHWLWNYPIQQGDHEAFGVRSILSIMAVHPLFGYGDGIYLYCQFPGKHLYGGKEEYAVPGDHSGGRCDQRNFKFFADPALWRKRRGIRHLYQLFRGLPAARGGHTALCTDAL